MKLSYKICLLLSLFLIGCNSENKLYVLKEKTKDTGVFEVLSPSGQPYNFNDFQLRVPETIGEKQVLSANDFNDFRFQYRENQNRWFIIMNLNADGQKKIQYHTKKLGFGKLAVVFGGINVASPGFQVELKTESLTSPIPSENFEQVKRLFQRKK